jgi:predicted outer membrane repeat protein
MRLGGRALRGVACLCCCVTAAGDDGVGTSSSGSCPATPSPGWKDSDGATCIDYVARNYCCAHWVTDCDLGTYLSAAHVSAADACPCACKCPEGGHTTAGEPALTLSSAGAWRFTWPGLSPNQCKGLGGKLRPAWVSGDFDPCQHACVGHLDDPCDASSLLSTQFGCPTLGQIGGRLYNRSSPLSGLNATECARACLALPTSSCTGFEFGYSSRDVTTHCYLRDATGKAATSTEESFASYPREVNSCYASTICPAVDVCGNNVISASNRWNNRWGTTGRLFYNGDTAAARSSRGCSSVIQALPHQHIELRFTSRYPTGPAHSSLVVDDPAYVQDIGVLLSADQGSAQRSARRLWPVLPSPPASASIVSSSYQLMVSVAPHSRAAQWEVSWAVLNGTCFDGIQNTAETGIDCGGPACRSCSRGCTDRGAVNFDAAAGIDDQSCTFSDGIPCGDIFASNTNTRVPPGWVYLRSCAYDCSGLARNLTRAIAAKWPQKVANPKILTQPGCLDEKHSDTDLVWGSGHTNVLFVGGDAASSSQWNLIAPADSSTLASVYIQGRGTDSVLWGRLSMVDSVNRGAEIVRGLLAVRYVRWRSSITGVAPPDQALKLDGIAGFVTHSLFEGAAGGAVSLAKRSVLAIEDTVFRGNNAAFGGAISVTQQSRLEARNTAFWFNWATELPCLHQPCDQVVLTSGSGGAIAQDSGSFMISNSQFIGESFLSSCAE